MKCYHSTTRGRLASIQQKGLLPNSEPMWFTDSTPYIMLAKEPWTDLNGSDTVVLEITDPRIREEYFDHPEGLRWPYSIRVEYLEELP